ncbi:cadherin EGF LAG seven-pass G-type receptor 1-like [Oculina patagonica]
MEASQNLLSQSFFQIDADSGVIKTSALLDREKMSMHYFRVKAEYDQHRSLYAEADLTIIVDDVNDNAPKFESSSYSKVIPEDIYVGDTVLDVRARDEDTGSNADIRYSITNNGGVNSVFRIGQDSGSITVDRALDRESVQEYSLTIQASDGGSPPKTDTATVRITVTDVNDCVPQFSKREYTAKIREDVKPGVLVLAVRASDKDLGSNAEIVYSFSSGNDQGLFSINRLNGEIKVSKKLDYEYIPVHTLFVMAQDKGEYPNYNETSVEIYLEDVNDNAPQFVNSDFQEVVSERENVGHTFTRVQAFDDDDGTNKQIVYSLVESNLPFGINSQTGDLYLTRKLDREKVDRYVFHVKAEDKGNPPLSNRAKVTVNVGDINDNPPKFSKPVYLGSVEENARFGTTILQVTATDPDLGQSNIVFTFDQSSRCFRISGNTGVITLSCRLDYSKTRFYSLTVKARDNHLESSAFVRINVTDSNTHKPIFQQRIYRQRISEATAVGGRVLVVKATDDDQGLNAKLTYAIEQSMQDFKINAKTGEIIVASQLDRETTPQYRFEVSATDHGTPRFKGTANVHITVTDVNDNKPRFLQSNYGKSILENVRPGTKVLEVSAVDDDEGSNKAIIYSFARNGDGGGAFQIDSTQGVIRTLLSLDRETIPEYELTVVASDKGRPSMKSSVKVKITLEDVRDSKPKFEKDPYIVFLREDVKERSDVLTVKAVSQDLVQGAAITYSIMSGNDPLTFVIQRDGLIQTRRKLDYETQSEYILKVRATSSPYFVETIVNITLIDVNDNKPVLQNFFMVINVKDDNFPKQPKFKIPAYDPDVSDSLLYQIESVTQGDWVFLNRTTGDLEISPTVLNTGKPVKLVVQVSDGKFSARASGRILVTSVTPQMLNSSLTLDIYDATIKEFFDSSYEELVEGIANVVGCDATQVTLFYIESKIIKGKTPYDDDISQLKIWFAIYKVDNSGNRFGFYDPQHVRDLIYINMVQIAKMAKLTLLPFEDSLCVKESCNFPLLESRKSCLSYTDFTDDSKTYSSLKVVFRTVGVQTAYRCLCSKDYRGKDCDTPLNLCYSNPCQDNGKCISTEASYSCVCNPGRTGVNCEIDMSNSKCPTDSEATENHLKLNPCRNNGNCRDSKGKGFSCVCSDDASDGPLCELKTRSFTKGSFIAFPALKQRWRLNIKLEFATTEHSGLLLFNGRYDGKHDFIAIEVWQGQVRFRFSLFSHTVTVASNVNGGVIDGKWHKVEVAFENRTGIIIVDDCKLAVAVNFGTKAASFSCAAARQLRVKEEPASYSSLDLTGPLLLGGLLQLPVDFPVPYEHFTGCIRNVYIDHKFLDLSRPLYNNGTTEKCKAMGNTCSSKPCQRGKCSNILGTRQCECPSGYGGSRCESAMAFTERFLGQSYKRVPDTSKVNLPWSFSLRFRTAKPSGTLVETSFSSSSSVLKLVSGKLQYNYNELLVLQLPHIAVNDTKWHHVNILWTDSSLNIIVDYIYSIGVASSSGKDLGRVSQLFIGARKNSTTTTVYGGFRGCIQGVSVGSTEIDINSGDKHNTASGCEKQMPSHCLSNPCPDYSTCQEEFDSYMCLCPAGYVGKHCVDVCSLRPCRHGRCEKTDTAKGFQCVCPKQYTGEFCEVRMEIPCRDKFFGASSIGVCGPCQCAIGMNLSPVCNKSTGECYCNPKHYRKIVNYKYMGGKSIPEFSDGCSRCDCEAIGSTGEYCAVVNGQCPCQKGKDGAKDVVGRRCNQCENKQGQIVSGRGCVVINTSCPRAFAEEIWWERAAFGKTGRQKCPFGSSGIATRMCDKDDGWQKPSLLDCVSNSFLVLQGRLKNLTSGVVHWEPDFAIGLAQKLDLAITLSPKLYAKDIDIALKIITTLFDYESKQNSSTLVSARTKEFAKILLLSASMLFSSDNKDVWDVVQQHSAGTAALLEQMENFSGNLARSLPYLKRDSHRYRRSTESILPPYTVITPNIVMELHPIFVNGFSGFSYPEKTDIYSDSSYKIWRNISNRIELPRDFFQGMKDIKNNIGVGFMVIKNIGDLLPESFDTKISDSKYNVEVSSDVISVKLPQMENVPLPNPIRIAFANRLVNRSDYICVHWNYSVPNTRGGGWSKDGCELKSTNVTHTVCTCTHLTAFAVLSDLNLQYPEQAAFAMRLVTYIGIAVSLALLLTAFILFMCIRKLKSNSVTIHKNLILGIFIAELTFLVGINRTEDQRICKLIAIVLHYFFSASFSWMFVEGLHMYRRLREKRNIDTGKMSFYYFMGWGCPAIVVGISAGLASEGYGNERFCWMSTDGTLIWTFTIPIIIVVALNTLVFIMALFISLTKQTKKRRRRHHHHHHHDDEKSSLTAGLWATAGLLPLIGVSFAFAILLVNQDLEMFHYVFAAFTFSQGLFILVFYLLLDKTVRKEFKNVYMRWKTKDKTYGIHKPAQHFKRSYHPGEMAPLRSPYDFDDDGNATSTSTTEPSSSGIRSSIASRFTTTDASETIGDEDSSVPDGVLPKSKYPDNPELELARKMWEQTDKSEVSTTQPESSSEEEEERPSSPGIPSDSSDSDDEQVPSENGWPKDKTPRKKRRKAPFYASDGPMHSTPMETTPEEEPPREADRDSESSDTGDEEIPTMERKKDHPSFKAVPEIIRDKGVSGSAATSDTTPSVDSSLKKKPLKSALKKPKNPIPIPVMEENNDDDSPDKPLNPSDDHHHHHHHKDKHRHHRDRPRSRASSGSGDYKEKKRRFRRKGSKKKAETLVQIGGEEYRVKLGDPTDFQDSQV